ncbi:DUF485 domain-containing protein [Streptacidiphilus sp. MAP5-3]|uniref:DUF485 domain-containing protein n=1 Tax=unclassified Streptacidiphilus TaxID=2643834 RepID=UPI0035119A48
MSPQELAERESAAQADRADPAASTDDAERVPPDLAQEPAPPEEPVPPEEPPDESEPEHRGGGFDWWAATPEARGKQQARQAHDARAERAAWAEPVEPVEPVALAEPAEGDVPGRAEAAAVYRAAHDSAEFRAIRTRYRRFVFPATLAFLLWYLLYVVLAVTAPQLMARPIAGPLNTAWLLGLLQFVSTFLLTWLYARHARNHRDRAALGLRWETQDRLR